MGDFIIDEKTGEIRDENGRCIGAAQSGAEPQEGGDKPKEKPIRAAVLEAGEFLRQKVPKKEIYLNPWIMAQIIFLVSGARGIGKSMFAMALLWAIAAGEAFGPWKCEKPVPCLYLDGEMVADDVQERLQGYEGGESPLYVYCDALASNMGIRRANLLDPEWRDEFKALLLELGIKVWVCDNIASLSPGIDENVKSEWDVLNQWFLELRYAGITSGLVHHTGKNGDQRGTSGREDNIDFSIILKKPFDYQTEDGARFVAHFTKHRIATRYLPLLADTEYKLAVDERGRQVWTHGNVKANTVTAVLKLLSEGVYQKDIAAELQVSGGRVSQIKRDLIDKGLIQKNGKLTVDGFARLQP